MRCCVVLCLHVHGTGESLCCRSSVHEHPSESRLPMKRSMLNGRRTPYFAQTNGCVRWPLRLQSNTVNNTSSLQFAALPCGKTRVASRGGWVGWCRVWASVGQEGQVNPSHTLLALRGWRMLLYVVLFCLMTCYAGFVVASRAGSHKLWKLHPYTEWLYGRISSCSHCYSCAGLVDTWAVMIPSCLGAGKAIQRCSSLHTSSHFNLV